MLNSLETRLQPYRGVPMALYCFIPPSQWVLPLKVDDEDVGQTGSGYHRRQKKPVFSMERDYRRHNTPLRCPALRLTSRNQDGWIQSPGGA